MDPRISAWVLMSVLLPATAGAAAILVLWAPSASSWLPEIPASANSRLETAVAMGDLSGAHAAIRNGAHVSTVVRFTHSELTGGLDYFGTPIVVAAARGDENVVRMLLAHGAHERADLALGKCVATALARSGVRQALEEWDARLEHVPCPMLAAGTPALLQLADLQPLAGVETRSTDRVP